MRRGASAHLERGGARWCEAASHEACRSWAQLCRANPAEAPRLTSAKPRQTWPHRTESVLELGANEGPEQWLLGPEANHRHTGAAGMLHGTRASVIGTREEQPTREGYEDAICFLVPHSAEFKGVRAGQAVTKGREGGKKKNF
ncbi:hypothetical protein B0H14DRAFT_2574570 [Mycena olivaceomarginata]|nr:hypothetical protein B0H14DRAFT_2574570 [Mycena olivaceomarginata]